MTHEHTGNYAAKHQNVTPPNTKLKNAILAAADDGRISCARAHAISQQNSISPAEVGQAADLLEIRLTDCQLGLFGMGRNPSPKPPEAPAKELEQAIKSALNGSRLSCSDAWKIASELKLTRKEVANACNALEIKVAPCQLGAF